MSYRLRQTGEKLSERALRALICRERFNPRDSSLDPVELHRFNGAFL